MGSTLSFYNDTDDVIYIKKTANTAVIAPIVAGVVAVAGAAATALTAGAAGSITVAGTTVTYAAIAGGAAASGTAIAKITADTVINDFEGKLASGYARDGFVAVQPGKEYKFGKQTLSLNQRLWCIRLDRGKDTMKIRTADSSVWTGATDKSNIRYRAGDTRYFKWATQDEYNFKPDPKMVGGAIDARGGEIAQQTGFSRISTVVTGLLLASNGPSIGPVFNKRGLLSKTAYSSPTSAKLALGGAPVSKKATFADKMADVLGDGI